MLYLQSKWIDFKNLKGVQKLKRFCITCIKFLKFLNFCLSEFRFQFEFFFNFDFHLHKTHPKSFVFEISFIGDSSSTFYLFDGKA